MNNYSELFRQDREILPCSRRIFPDSVKLELRASFSTNKIYKTEIKTQNLQNILLIFSSKKFAYFFSFLHFFVR